MASGKKYENYDDWSHQCSALLMNSIGSSPLSRRFFDCSETVNINTAIVSSSADDAAPLDDLQAAIKPCELHWHGPGRRLKRLAGPFPRPPSLRFGPV